MTPLAALLLVLACIWELNLNPIRWKDWPWYPVTITGHMNFHNDWPVWDRRPYSDEDLVYPSYYHQLLGVGAKYIPHER